MRCFTTSIRLTALILIIALVMFGCANPNFSAETAELPSPVPSLQDVYDAFSYVRQHLLDGDLNLKIYSLGYNVLTYAPLCTEDIIGHSLTEMIFVKNVDLQKHEELFDLLQPDVLNSVNNDDSPDVRLCYVFETSDGKPILTVAFSYIVLNWDSMETINTVIVNGYEFHYNNALYEMIRPFITVEMRETFDAIFDYG